MKDEIGDSILTRTHRAIPRLCLVVPCYNEEEVLPVSVPELRKTLIDMIGEGLIQASSFMLLVNDGSTDSTWSIINNFAKDTAEVAEARVTGLSLTRNRGHQNALIAGLDMAKRLADVAISIDCDLQDDTRVMHDMILKYLDGADIVYGVRHKRDSDTAFKRQSAQGYYRLMKLLGVELIYNHADYRLMSKRVLRALDRFEERNLFLRGLIPQLGFPHAEVYYDRKPRELGESKYTLAKMLRLAGEGVTSFSVRPIRIIGVMGVFIFSVSIIILIYILARYFGGQTVEGWTTTVASVWALGGLQILSLAVIGEYVGKIYLETKKRPRYLIERTAGLAELQTIGEPGTPVYNTEVEELNE